MERKISGKSKTWIPDIDSGKGKSKPGFTGAKGPGKGPGKSKDKAPSANKRLAREARQNLQASLPGSLGNLEPRNEYVMPYGDDGHPLRVTAEAMTAKADNNLSQCLALFPSPPCNC